MDPDASVQIPHPQNPPIYNDIMWITLFVLIGGLLLWKNRKCKTIGPIALMFIGSWSMFWQEFYNNWGGYLLYSPDLNLLPWGSTWWTAPNKPVFIIFSYPVFFTVVYFLLTRLLWKIDALLGKRVPLILTSLIVGIPLFWAYNFVIDGASVDAGIWNYVDTIGPIVKTHGGGTEPLLWPMLLFACYGALMAYSLARVDEKGYPTFFRLAQLERIPKGFRREAARAAVSVVWWNGMYLFLMTLPINLVREFLGSPSALVP